MKARGKQLAERQPARGVELEILQSLRRIIRAVDIHSRKLTSLHGITGPQLVCLATLCEEGPLASTELSRRVYVSASTITGIIDRLEQRGCIERRRDDADRRRVLLHPTDEGRRLAARAPMPLQDRLTERLQNLSASDREAIAASLARVVELMEAEGLEAAAMLVSGALPEETEPAESALRSRRTASLAKSPSRRTRRAR